MASCGVGRCVQFASNAADKRVFRMLRRTADAIVIGAGTIAAEDVGPLRPNQTWEQWRREHRDRVQVPIIAVSNRGNLPPSSRLFSGLRIGHAGDAETTDPTGSNSCVPSPRSCCSDGTGSIWRRC